MTLEILVIAELIVMQTIGIFVIIFLRQLERDFLKEIRRIEMKCMKKKR